MTRTWLTTPILKGELTFVTGLGADDVAWRGRCLGGGGVGRIYIMLQHRVTLQVGAVLQAALSGALPPNPAIIGNSVQLEGALLSSVRLVHQNHPKISLTLSII